MVSIRLTFTSGVVIPTSGLSQSRVVAVNTLDTGVEQKTNLSNQYTIPLITPQLPQTQNESNASNQYKIPLITLRLP